MGDLNSILSKFLGVRILIIGDIMLDRYLEGDVSRINPEAPVPILSLKKEHNSLGGAANVAANIVSLGGEAVLFGFIGKDLDAEILKSLAHQKQIKFFPQETQVTTVKTRLVAANQQLLRFDNEETSFKEFSKEAIEKLKEEAAKASIILISDYAKGTINQNIMNILEPFKNKTIVDPKPSNREFYHGVHLLTPNEKEAFEMSDCTDFLKAGSWLKEKLNSNIIITRGAKGMALFSDKNLEIPTNAKEVYDVTGAGDTVIATLAIALAAGASLEDSAILANFSAGIKVSKKGTYSVSLEELKNTVDSNETKIMTLDLLKSKVVDYKRKSKKVVWTNGIFDLLHPGHVRYLREAKKIGDVLIVGINSDSSTKALKGESRPIQSQEERAEIIASLESVDQVIIFPELSCERYLSELQPDYFVKGGDYNILRINEKEKNAVESYGGKIRLIMLTEGKSTTNIIENIKNKNL